MVKPAWKKPLETMRFEVEALPAIEMLPARVEVPVKVEVRAPFRVVVELTVNSEVEAVPLILMLVPVALVKSRSVMVPAVAVRFEAKKLVEVELVVEALVAKKLVVVALVPVALRKVKFCKVDDPVTKRLEKLAEPPNTGRPRLEVPVKV